MKRIQLNEIPDIEYNGYLWFDNSDSPELIDSSYDFTAVQPHPFIIEGNLKAKDGSVSISIRFLDGEYIVFMVDWNQAMATGCKIEQHKYLAHGFAGSTTLLFKEAWLPVQDENCAGMETLRPAWIAFDGFGPAEEVQND